MLDFTSDTHKLNAKRNRERGGSTIRVFASTNAMHKRADASLSPHSLAVAEIKSRWSFDRSEAVAAFQCALCGDDLIASGFGDL